GRHDPGYTACATQHRKLRRSFHLMKPSSSWMRTVGRLIPAWLDGGGFHLLKRTGSIGARPPKMKPQSMNSNGCAGPAQISLSSLGRRSGGLSTIQASTSIFLPNIDVFGRMTGWSFLIYAESQNPH